MSFDDILYEKNAIEEEARRIKNHDTRSSSYEIDRLASRRVRRAIKDILKGVRPRLKGFYN